MKIEKKILALAILIGTYTVSTSCMEPAQPTNPYVKLQNHAGDSVWVHKQQLDNLLAAANQSPLGQVQEGIVAFNYPKHILNIFSDLLLIHQSFLLQGKDLQPVTVPQFNRALEPVFFDNPEFGNHSLVFNYFASVLQERLSEGELFELMNIIKTYFPRAYFEVLVWAIVKTQGQQALVIKDLPASLSAEEIFITTMFRYAFPPEDSIYSRFIIKKERFKTEYEPQNNLCFIEPILKFKKIKSIFGLGALLQRTRLAAAEYANQKEIFFLVLLEYNLITIIDDSDAYELAKSDAWLHKINLENNQLTMISNHFLNNVPQLKTLNLINNNLTHLPENFLSDAPSLEHLYLDGNHITQLPDQFLSSSLLLDYLSLSSNKITSFKDNFLQLNKQLDTFDASFNRDLQLPHNFLSDAYPELTVVALEACDLSALPDRFLQGATALKYVNLKRNKLEKLPHGLVQQRTIETLILGGNPVAYNESYLKTLPENIHEAIKNIRQDEESDEDEQ